MSDSGRQIGKCLYGNLREFCNPCEIIRLNAELKTLRQQHLELVDRYKELCDILISAGKKSEYYMKEKWGMS